MILLFANSCNRYSYEPLNREMLNSRNQEFWDYYHGSSICDKIRIYDSVMVDKMIYYDTTEIRKIIMLWDEYMLYQHNPHSFYGYIYFDIYSVTDTACCDKGRIGSGPAYYPLEYPFSFETIDSLHALTKLWKEKMNCEDN